MNECDRNPKRPRIDDIQNSQSSLRVSLDVERRLQLIRDHGGASAGPLAPEGGAASMMPGVNRETNRYVQEPSDFDGSYNRPGTAEYRRFDGFRDSSSEPGPIGYDPRFGSGDRRGKQYMQNNRNGFQGEELPHSRHGQVESSLNSFQTHGIQNVDQLRPPYPVSEVPNDGYHDIQNLQQPQRSDSVPATEPQYSNMSNWQGACAPYPEQRSGVTMDNRELNSQLQQPYGMQYPVAMRHDLHPPGTSSDARPPLEVRFPSQSGNRGPIGSHTMPGVAQPGGPRMNGHGGYFPTAPGAGRIVENMGQTEASRLHSRQPPIPASSLSPVPVDPALRPSSELKVFSSPQPTTSASLFPIPVSSSPIVPSSHSPLPETHSLSRPYYNIEPRPPLPASAGFVSEAVRDGRAFSLTQLSSDKPKVVDASHLFKMPHRASRPDHIVIILRGLPGSGKSYMAKMVRDLEVENGGNAPRIHSMDDYFMTEVEKADEGDISKSSGSVRGKKSVMKKVMEYCYEPEMEEAYRSSMLKAFKKTLEEGVFTFIIGMHLLI